MGFGHTRDQYHKEIVGPERPHAESFAALPAVPGDGEVLPPTADAVGYSLAAASAAPTPVRFLRDCMDATRPETRSIRVGQSSASGRVVASAAACPGYTFRCKNHSP
jgi:hypothetical protein